MNRKEVIGNLSNGENALLSCGFILVHKEDMVISQSLKYSTYKYARYFDNDHTGVDSTVVFDTSQKSIEVWNSYCSTCFLSIKEIQAIYKRAKELGYQESINTLGECGE